MKGKSTFTMLSWVWLTYLGSVRRPNPYALLYQTRKPWKIRSLAWEAHMRAERQYKYEPHLPAEFFPLEYTIRSVPFAHVRKPWKRQNTYQVIMRLDHSS